MNPFDKLCQALTMDELAEFCLVIKAGQILTYQRVRRSAYEALDFAFWWDGSPQGGDYWRKVYRRLRRDER